MSAGESGRSEVLVFKRNLVLCQSINFQPSESESECIMKLAINLYEGGVRVCGDAVRRYFWSGFAVIFILTCGIAVLQN